MPTPQPKLSRIIPSDAPGRMLLHDEVHARPPARIRLPALVLYIAVLNEGISREQECGHLRLLPGQEALIPDRLSGNFLRLRCDGFTVKWERHTEFTRYSLVQPLPEGALLGAHDPDLHSVMIPSTEWLGGIPGRTISAVFIAMVHGDLTRPETMAADAQSWFGTNPIVASLMGANGHSCAFADFQVRPDGFERMLVIAPAAISETRPGRIAQRLLEIETYRILALTGLVVAKELGPKLARSELALAEITTLLEEKRDSDQELLERLVALAAGVERATAQHSFRFSATKAYHALVSQRITELRERSIPGIQTIGEFMERRLSPAMATVAAAAQRLASLSERISRASALLRTRVDIATELQNQVLLEKLTRGQEMQLRLQSTVEGLSIAAISYYVLSLLVYGVKALKSAGLPLDPEVTAGALIPLVVWAVWRATKRIRKGLHSDQ